MDKDYFLRLTAAVYRVTELFPKEEPIKILIREKACQILADLVLFFSSRSSGLKEEKNKTLEKLFNNIEVLERYFDLSQEMNWLDKANLFILKREYAKIKKELNDKKEPISCQKELTAVPSQNNKILNGRHKKILEVLKQKEKVQLGELKTVFPEISKRTLRRDFHFLLTQGLVERMGDKTNTYYIINNK